MQDLERKVVRLEEKLDNTDAKSKEFKFKSNKEQFQLNKKLSKEVRAAKKYSKSDKHHDSRRKLRRVIKQLQKRNKLVMIADKAKSGWKAVELYKSHEVASNEADDRKMRQEDREKKQGSGTGIICGFGMPPAKKIVQQIHRITVT